MTEAIASSIEHQLRLTADELNSLFTAGPVGGYTGAQVAERLRREFSLPDDDELADALEDAGVLTADEAAWLRDAD